MIAVDLGVGDGVFCGVLFNQFSAAEGGEDGDFFWFDLFELLNDLLRAAVVDGGDFLVVDLLPFLGGSRADGDDVRDFFGVEVKCFLF